MTAARKDLLTSETETRSFPDKHAKMSWRQSRLMLSADTMTSNVVWVVICAVVTGGGAETRGERHG